MTDSDASTVSTQGGGSISALNWISLGMISLPLLAYGGDAPVRTDSDLVPQGVTGAVVVESTEVTAADVAMAFANLHQRIVQASRDMDPEAEAVLRDNLWSLYDS